MSNLDTRLEEMVAFCQGATGEKRPHPNNVANLCLAVIAERRRQWIPFNINMYVRVKLKQRGLDELRRQREEARKLNPLLDEFSEPKVDEEGYSKFQLWSLMEDLGHLCEMGREPPFETTIYFDAEG